MTLTEKIHKAAKKNGWWDSPRSPYKLAMLCVGELSEAVEALRNGKSPVDVEAYAGLESLQNTPAVFTEQFDERFRGSVEEEIADTIIRLHDWAGHLGHKLNSLNVHSAVADNLMVDEEYMYVELARATEKILSLTTYNSKSHFDCAVQLCVWVWTRFTDVRVERLEQLIHMKLLYNSYRGIRHGGKQF